MTSWTTQLIAEKRRPTIAAAPKRVVPRSASSSRAGVKARAMAWTMPAPTRSTRVMRTSGPQLARNLSKA
jgi:hypothetical protein